MHINTYTVYTKGSKTQETYYKTPYLPLSHRRLRNDLYCVEWGVKLYSLSLSHRRGDVERDQLIGEELC